jgi:hypothetical protein
MSSYNYDFFETDFENNPNHANESSTSTDDFLETFLESLFEPFLEHSPEPYRKKRSREETEESEEKRLTYDLPHWCLDPGIRRDDWYPKKRLNKQKRSRSPK